MLHGLTLKTLAGKSSYPKSRDSCSVDSFMVNRTLAIQINFYSKSNVLGADANH